MGAGLLVMFAVFGQLAASAAAVTLYVRPGGADGNDGLSPNTALASIATAASRARADDRVLVAPGTYREGLIRPAGFARITLSADRRGTAFGVAAGDVVIDASGFASAIELNNNLSMVIDGFVIHGSAIGIYVKSESHRATVLNNRVSRCGGNGIYVQDSQDVTVFNNLVYGNGGTGILLTGNVIGSARASVVNNTVYNNGNRGIFFSGTDIGSPQGLVLNNALAGNVTSGDQPLGIQVNASSRGGYVSGGNITADRFASSTPSDATDRIVDPQFLDPDGVDGVLGGDGYADDRFQLPQVAAGQGFDSPAVDAGSDRARALGFGRASTRSDGRSDRRWVDAGFHYGYFGTAPLDPARLIRTKDIFVSPDGNDANDGSTTALALKTIKVALERLEIGERIVLLPGTYVEGQLSFPQSGMPRRPLTVRGSGTVVIDAAGLDRGFLLSTRSNVLVENLEVRGSSNAAIEVRNGATNVVLRDLVLASNERRGLYVNDAAQARGERLIIRTSGTRGIQVTGASLDLSDSSIAASGDQGVWATDQASVGLTGCAITTSAAAAVQAEGATLRATDCLIHNNPGGGVRLLNASEATLTATAVRNNGAVGVRAIASTAQVIGGEIAGNGDGGVEILGGDGAPTLVEISNATVSANLGAGVRVQRASAKLTAGSICRNDKQGVSAEAAAVDIDRVEICDNLLQGALQQGGTLTLRNANVVRNGAEGLSTTAMNRLDVQGGSLDGNVVAGLRIEGASAMLSNVSICAGPDVGIRAIEAQLSLSGATVCDNGKQGLLLQGGTASLRDSHVVRNVGEGISAFAMNTIDMQGGNLDGNRAVGLRLQESAARLTQVSLCQSGAAGIRAVDSQVDLDRTVVCDSMDQGIFQQRGSLALRGSEVSGNGANGIEAEALSSFSVSGGKLDSNEGHGLQLTGGPLTLATTQACRNGGSGVWLKDVVLLASDGLFCENAEIGLRQEGGSAEVQRAVVLANAQGGITVSAAARFDLQEATVEHNQNTGVLALDVAAATMQRSTVCDNPAVGVRLQDTAAVLSEVNVCRNERDGIRQDKGSLTLTRVTAEDNGNKGITSTGALQLVVQNSNVSGNGDVGLQVATGGPVSVSDTEIAGNVGHGLAALANNGAVSAQRVTIRGNAQTGVVAQNSNLSVSDSRISDSGDGGVRFGGGSVGLIDNTTVALNLDVGVQVVSSAVRIAGSRVDRNTRSGVEAIVDTASGVSSATIVASSVCQTRGIGVRADRATVMLEDALVCAGEADGVRQNGGALSLFGSSVRDNAGAGLSVDAVSALMLDETAVLQNLDDGIVLTNAATAELDDVSITSNGGAGLVLDTVTTASVRRSAIRHSTRAGVSATDTGLSLTDTAVSHCGGDALRINGGSLDLAGSHLHDSAGNGVSASDLSACDVSDSRVFGNTQNGVQVSRVTGSSISRSELFANGGDGVTLLDAAAAMVWNNLIYGNCSTGVLVGGSQMGSPGLQVLNNTISANPNRGIFISATDLSQPGAATVLRNVLQGNGSAGIQVNATAMDGYRGDYNLSVDPYVAPVGTHDILVDPQFVSPPTGVCRSVGAVDFHLKQAAAGQTPQSPAVDAGDVDVAAAGLQGTTTRSDKGLDVGRVDLGYHFQP